MPRPYVSDLPGRGHGGGRRRARIGADRAALSNPAKPKLLDEITAEQLRLPGDPNPRNATNIAGVYVIDAKNPADLKLLSFEQLPTGHTTTCVNDCEWLWTGGPAPTDKQEDAGWLGGRPIIVTDLRDPRNPVGYPQKPVDLFRQDGITADAHDVDVDVLRFKKGAKSASAAKKEVSAGKLSAAQQKFLKAQSSKWVPDPSTGSLCMVPKY